MQKCRFWQKIQFLDRNVKNEEKLHFVCFLVTSSRKFVFGLQYRFGCFATFVCILTSYLRFLLLVILKPVVLLYVSNSHLLGSFHIVKDFVFWNLYVCHLLPFLYSTRSLCRWSSSPDITASSAYFFPLTSSYLFLADLISMMIFSIKILKRTGLRLSLCLILVETGLKQILVESVSFDFLNKSATYFRCSHLEWLYWYSDSSKAIL